MKNEQQKFGNQGQQGQRQPGQGQGQYGSNQKDDKGRKASSSDQRGR